MEDKGEERRESMLTVVQTSSHIEASHRRKAFPWYAFSRAFVRAPHA
jgi:hypothetical protein